MTSYDTIDDNEKNYIKSKYAIAFKLFKDGRPLTDVAIELDIESPPVLCYHEDFLNLANMRTLVSVYNELKNDLSLFLQMFRSIKKEGLGKQQIPELLENTNRLLDLQDGMDLKDILNSHDRTTQNAYLRWTSTHA